MPLALVSDEGGYEAVRFVIPEGYATELRVDWLEAHRELHGDQRQQKAPRGGAAAAAKKPFFNAAHAPVLVTISGTFTNTGASLPVFDNLEDDARCPLSPEVSSTVSKAIKEITTPVLKAATPPARSSDLALPAAKRARVEVAGAEEEEEEEYEEIEEYEEVEEEEDDEDEYDECRVKARKVAVDGDDDDDDGVISLEKLPKLPSSWGAMTQEEKKEAVRRIQQGYGSDTEPVDIDSDDDESVDSDGWVGGDGGFDGFGDMEELEELEEWEEGEETEE